MVTKNGAVYSAVSLFLVTIYQAKVYIVRGPQIKYTSSLNKFIKGK